MPFFNDKAVKRHPHVVEAQAQHEADYEDLLQDMAMSRSADDSKDDLGLEIQDARARLPTELADEATGLVFFESEDKLKATVKVTAECRSCDKAVHVLKDEKDNFYLLAKGDDYIVPAGAHLGGLGGGHMLPLEADCKRCVPWSFPQGDRTLVQLAKNIGEGEPDGQGKEAKGPKFVTGTLYAIVRDIEATAMAPPKLTSFGSLIPCGTAGRRQYSFEVPEDHEKHEKLAFVPAPGGRDGKEKVTSAQNIFQTAVNRDTGLGQGALAVAWRLNYDSVANVLKPSKPHVVAGKRISLKKGCPACAAWS